MRRARLLLTGALLVLLLAAVWLWHVNYNDGIDVTGDAAPAVDHSSLAALRERGAYLARAGNCMACHTARGGPPWAGGRPIPTPFGTVFSSNLTPDKDTGIGAWNAAAFWRALHRGRSRDGRLLYPAFPYTHTTQITRADSDALHAFLLSLPPQHGRPPAHQLRWPYGTQGALAVWRALYFRPGVFQPDPAREPAWNRGAYLVRGVAHCSACHAARDVLAGAHWQDLSGGVMPAQGWYAPSLTSSNQAGVADWPLQDIVRLLKSGHARGASASGPMAEVVSHSTQHLGDDDLAAMALYLKALPATDAPKATAPDAPLRARSNAVIAGQKIYDDRCAACHGSQGEGVPDAYPALAGNRAVTLPRTENLLQIVLYGGFGAATASHPRPYGMPPFVLTLNDAEIAAVLSTIRTSWGNQAAEVSALDVHNLRTAAAGRPQ